MNKATYIREPEMNHKKTFAYHLDFKRAMWKRPYLDAFIARLGKWGYNALVCEMEDKFRFDHLSAVNHPEAWTHAAVSDFAAKCRKAGIQVIPLMQSLGHLEFIVGKKEYAHLREAPGLTAHIDVTNPDSIPFLINLIDEIIEAFRPPQYVHLGGDETRQLGNSKRCAPLMKKIGRGGLYLKHMLPLLEHIHKRGLTPIIWADMALTYPDIIAKMPKYAAFMEWEYYLTSERSKKVIVWGGFGSGNNQLNREQLRKKADLPFRRNLMKYALDDQSRKDGLLNAFYCTDALLAKGFKVLTAPANRCSGDLVGIPISSRHVPNCFYFSRKGMRVGAGTLVTSWAVRHNHPEVDLPGTYAAAWGLEKKGDFHSDEFWKAYTAEMYGVELPGFAEGVTLAENGEKIPFLHAQTLRNLSTNGIKTISLKNLPADLAFKLGGKNKARLYLENVLGGYGKASAMFKRFQKKAHRNAGNLEYWLEGIAANGLLLRLALAILNKSLPRERNRLAMALARTRNKTWKLFNKTYLPQGVANEAVIRYGFITKCLDR